MSLQDIIQRDESETPAPAHTPAPLPPLAFTPPSAKPSDEQRPPLAPLAPLVTRSQPTPEPEPLALYAPPVSGQEAIRVIVAAQPESGGPFLAALPPGNTQGVEFMSMARGKHELMDDIHQYRPHIVLVSPNIREYSVDIIKELANWPDYPIAVVGLVPNSGAWGSEMASQGAVAFYNTPVTPNLIDQFRREARDIVDKARVAWRAPVIASGVSRTVVDVVGAMAFRTGVNVFWSPKGGVGKTMLAIETAAVVSQLGGRRTLLIDTNMNGGHVGLRLNLREVAKRNNIAHLAADYLAYNGRLNAQMLAGRVFRADAHFDPRTKVTQNRLDILLGIPNVELAGSEALQAKQGLQFITDLLKLAREQYEFVIVDNGSSVVNAVHLGVLDMADLVLFVTSADSASIIDSAETLDLLQRKRSLNREKFKVVVNQYNAQLSNIDLKAIAGYLKMPIFATVANETSLSLQNAGNDGKPFTMLNLNIRKNSPEVEATMRGIFSVAEGIYPPLSPIISARNEQIDGAKRGGLFGVFNIFRRGKR